MRSAYDIAYETAIQDRSIVVIVVGVQDGQRVFWIRSYGAPPPTRERIYAMSDHERSWMTVQLATHCATDARKAGVRL